MQLGPLFGRLRKKEKEEERKKTQDHNRNRAVPKLAASCVPQSGLTGCGVFPQAYLPYHHTTIVKQPVPNLWWSRTDDVARRKYGDVTSVPDVDV